MKVRDCISLEWDAQIQPLIDDVCLSVASVMEGGAANMFHEHSPVGLYTRIYEMTVRHRCDFGDLDFMHVRQVHTIVSFCQCFRAKDLLSLSRHLQGIGLLVRWFGCFFHHLNLFRRRVYGDDCATAEEDMMAAVRAHYIYPHQQDLLSWLRVAWSVRQVVDHALDVVRATESTLRAELVSLYLSCLRDYYASFSGGDGVAYMKQVIVVFEEEEKLFLTYFRGHNFADAHAVLREVLVFPRQDGLLGVWAELVANGDVAGARVFTRFFSLSTCQDAWVKAYKEFAASRVRSPRVDKLYAFLRVQLRFLHAVFDHDKRHSGFIRVVEASVRGSFTPAVVSQWVWDAHHRLSACRPAAMLRLIPYCPDKDDLCVQYHAFFRARLLTGSFDADLELVVIDVLERAFGASFVLNMRLMLKEYGEAELAFQSCGVRRLSRVAWGFECGALAFRPPTPVLTALASLHAQWREKTDPSIRLELLPLEGSVQMTSGHVMSPVQAIVLLALRGVPLARRDLVAALGVPDDDAHNITGILRSLEKAGLVVCDNEDHWRHAFTLPPPSFVPAPLPSSLQEDGSTQQTTVALEAFVVRTLKSKQASGMSLTALCRLLAPRVSARRVRKLVDGLVRREYLSWHGDDRLVYLP